MNHHLTLKAKIIIMVSVMASLFLVALDQTIISTALGKIVQDFNAYDSLSWIVTAYLVTTTITVPIAGKLSDLFGRKKMLLIGVTIFGIGSLLSGASPNVIFLIAARAFQGIGGGIITANAFTIVGDLFAARERGRWQGLISAVFGIASVIGPLLGGFLTESHSVLGLTHTDWRWTFWINIPVAIGALVIISIFCPPLKHDNKPRVDYVGAGLVAVVLGVLIFAIDNTGQIFSGLLSATGLSLVSLRIIMYGIVALALAALMIVEKRAPEPIIRLAFFKNKNFSLIMIIAFLHGAAFLGAILYLTQFNQQVFGATPTQSGLMLLPLMAGLMTASIGVGQIVSKIGKYKLLLVAGFVVMAISIGLLTTLTPTTGYFREAIIMFFVGLGIGTAMPIMNMAVQNEFEQKDLGSVTSSTQLFRNLGSTIGTAIFGSLLTVGIATSLGDMKADPYIHTLRQSPAGVKIVSSTTDSNTLLNLNTPAVKDQITASFNANITKLPIAQQTIARTTFLKNQTAYSSKIVSAFSTSIHSIFVVATILVSIAAVGTVFIKERTLRTVNSSETPGEV
jgi:EmrB/QacA subfamily drug resistance transporter